MQQKTIFLIARTAISLTFLGHGILAIGINPKWIILLTTVSFSGEQAIMLMPLIGFLDVLVAILVLFKPSKPLLIWMIFWAFSTALSRVIAGDSILELVERSSNFGLPLVLLLTLYYTKSYKLK